MIDRFAWPWMFVLLLAVPIMFWIAFRPSTRTAVRMAMPAAMRSIGVSWRTRLRFLPVLVRAAASILLITAAARPQESEGRTQTTTEGIAIQLVVDRSSSMNEAMAFDGEAVPRIDVVKQVVRDFIAGDDGELEGREGDMIGLVSFARYADTTCPLVRSHDALLELLKGVETATIRSEDGTAIGDALALGVARLQRAEIEVSRSQPDDAPPDFTIRSKIMVLLTDGRNNRGQVDPIDAARVAAERGIKIYAIGIGGRDEGREVFGMRLQTGTGVDEDLLTTIAERTGGRYWLAGDAQALREVYAEIDRLETTQIETTETTAYSDLFAIFAVPAFVLLAIEFALRALVFRRVP